jgi:transposase
MYVERIPNRNSPPAVLLREAWREDGKICKRTIANLSDWPDEKVEALRRVLRDEPVVTPKDAFRVEASTPHGHVEAILGTIRKLGLDEWIASKRSRQRDLVLALMVERLIHPCSKLATTRLWQTTTLGEELSVNDADEDELYDTLDWLLAAQNRIEKKLASRHLAEGGLVLYDVSSSYYEGRTCPLAQFGHDRDGKKGLPIIVYGVLTNGEGCPVAIDVYKGNTGDPSTLLDQVQKLRQRFGLTRLVLVGDRGMITQAKIDALKQTSGLGWITALRSEAIRGLVEGGHLQRSLFDQTNLAEIHSPDYPDERLIACFNPLMAEERRRKREELLQETEKELTRISKEASRRTKTPMDDKTIGMKVGKVINRFKVGKHFEIKIENGRLACHRQEEAIRREGELDGIYVVRTNQTLQQLSAPDTVRSYKSLADVERAFRSLKGIDLRVRPIYHRTEDHVRAHFFLCMLAYYVEWHMRRSLAPILFHDEDLPHSRQQRDPVAPAQISASAKQKKIRRRTADDLPIHSFHTLLQALSLRCRNRCSIKSDPVSPAFYQITEMDPLQKRAFELLGL